MEDHGILIEWGVSCRTSRSIQEDGTVSEPVEASFILTPSKSQKRTVYNIYILYIGGPFI